MVEAIARVLSRWWLAVALLAAPSVALAQFEKAAAKKEDAKAADVPKDETGVVDKEKADKQETSEVFEDPRTKPLLKNTFKEFPDAKPGLTNTDFSAMRNMAANVVGVNRDLMSRFLDQMAADLTKHENIKAVISPDPSLRANAQPVRAIERASQILIELLNTAKERRNDNFLAQFVPLLFAKFTPLLDGHLLTRIQANIILAHAATKDHVALFIKQITDPKQVVWVKHWAARALTNAAGNGRATLAINDQTAATAALLGFLDKEPETPWPVKLRVLEALGSIRLASTAGINGKPDVAAYAFAGMTDPGARPEVRAWSAWSLGMLTIPAAAANYSMKLAAYGLGRLAADLGDRMVAEYDLRKEKFTKAGQSDYTRYLAGMLLYQVYPALAGEDGVANSGMLNSKHPAAGPARPFMMGLDEQLKALGRAANELLTAGGGQVQEARDNLAARVTDLKSFLDKNRPAANETELFAGGPKIQLPPVTPTPTQVPRAAPRRP
jgi:hypothetical protein